METNNENQNKGQVIPNDPKSSSSSEKPSVNPVIPKPVSEGPKMVTVSLDALEELKAQIVSLNKKVDATGDKSRIAEFNLKNNTKTTPICRISYFRDQNGDRLIMGWGNMVSNKAKYGKNFEQVDQRCVLFLRDPSKKEDGSPKFPNGIVSLEVDYVSFAQNRFQEEVEIMSTNTMNDGRRIFKVMKEDGEEIEMDERFVN